MAQTHIGAGKWESTVKVSGVSGESLSVVFGRYLFRESTMKVSGVS